MIRLARKLLDGFVAAAKAGPANDPRIDDFAAVIDTCLDAAEIAIAPEYDPPTVLADTREQRPSAPFLWQKGKREWFVGYVLSRAHTQATSAAEAKKAAKRGLSLPWAFDPAKAVKQAADAIREGLTP